MKFMINVIQEDSYRESNSQRMHSLVYLKDGRIGNRPDNIEIVFNGVYSTLDPFNVRGTTQTNLSNESSVAADSSRIQPSNFNKKSISPSPNMKIGSPKWRKSRDRSLKEAKSKEILSHEPFKIKIAELEAEIKKLNERNTNLQTTIDQLRKNFNKEMLRIKERSLLKTSKNDWRDDPPFIRYLNDLEVIDEDSRKILNCRLEEASILFNKTIEDHIKYQKGLIKEIVHLRNLNTTYLKMIEMPKEDISKILLSFDEKEKAKRSHEGKKAEEAFMKEVKQIRRDCDNKLK